MTLGFGQGSSKDDVRMAGWCCVPIPAWRLPLGTTANSTGLGCLCPEQSSSTIPAGSALAIAQKSHGRPKYIQELEITPIYLYWHSLRGELGLHGGDGAQHHTGAQQIKIITFW